MSLTFNRDQSFKSSYLEIIMSHLYGKSKITLYSDEDWDVPTCTAVKIMNHATKATHTVLMLETAASVV